jgi:DNA invertase Pin-like site-specific DNA recombinase
MDSYKDTAVSQRVAGVARQHAKRVRSKPRVASTATEDVGYARASKDAAVDHKGRPRAKGKSVARQRADGDILAKAHKLAPLEWFIDNNLSGGDFVDRPKYDALLLKIEAGLVRTVVTDALDRIGREGLEQQEFLLICEVYGVRVVTGEGDDIDYTHTDPDNAVLSAEVRGSVAKMERNKIRRRMRKDIAYRARNGAAHSGKRAFGFEADNVTHRPDEVRLIKAAVKAIKSGVATQGTIAAEWQAQGVPTSETEKRIAKGLEPGRWHPEVVKNMLLSPRMIGKRTHHGELYDGKWKGIITEKDQDLIRAKMCQAPQGAKARVALLTGGLVRCGLCGHPMSTFSPKGVRKYRCWTLRGGCGGVTILAEELERIVVAGFFYRLDQIYGGSKLRAIKNADDDRARLIAEIGLHKAKLSDLAELYGSDKMSRADYERQQDKRERMLKAAERKLAETPDGHAIAELVSSKDQLRADWDKPTMTVGRRHAALALLLDHVPIHRATPPFHTFNPDRVGEPVWRA